jgi:hypothetical protein
MISRLSHKKWDGLHKLITVFPGSGESDAIRIPEMDQPVEKVFT